APQVTISYTLAGLTAPIQPKLHLRITGPHAVTGGQIASYRITVSRTQPNHRRVYPVRNVHVVTKHARRLLRKWVVSTLPRGHSRKLHLRVRVPTSAHGRFCIATTATTPRARGAFSRYCVPVAT